MKHLENIVIHCEPLVKHPETLLEHCETLNTRYLPVCRV